MPRVLLVDTDQRHAECVRGVLGFHGIEVDTYQDPEQAVARLRRSGNDYDVVILNVSNTSSPWVSILARLHAALHESGASPAPLLLCTSTTKQSPEFELLIERMGARYACER